MSRTLIRRIMLPLAAATAVILASVGQPAHAQSSPTPTATTTDQGDMTTASIPGYYATMINAVYLNDSKEPIVRGAAEIFSIVAGFRADGKPAINIVDMPYLDHGKTTYYPKQLLVHWPTGKYLHNTVDVIMMEDNGSRDYQQLANALAAELAHISGKNGWVPLAQPILNALASIGVADVKHVDSWHKLTPNSTGRHHGVQANGWMDLFRYYVPPISGPGIPYGVTAIQPALS
ncbi:MAG TPA: DUF3103 family protein [Micromonospora sp.]|nr:DUF3103 family protein [Micromonospora sp.]